MKYYLKLLNWEIMRFSKLYGALAVVLVLSQFLGIWLTSHSYLSNMRAWIERNGATEAAYAEQFQKARLTNVYNSLWFEGAIFLCASVLVLYVFLIWYKEWFSRTTFAYRLLMLPTSRMNVFAAKLSAIVLFVFGFVALQAAIIPLQMAIFHAMISFELREAMTMTELIRNEQMLRLFLPTTFSEFLIYYGAGIMSVIVMFTAILLERSYRYKGIIAGILYSAAVLFVILSPHWISELMGAWMSFPLYPSEILLLQVFFGLGIAAISIKLSSILLQKKVTV